MMKRLTALILVVTMLVASLTGCGGPTASFEAQVKKGNYSQAIEIYNEKIAGNAGDENAAITFLSSYLEEGFAGYVDGSLEEQAFLDRYATLEKINAALWVLDDLSFTYEQYLGIKDSKESYRVAMEHADKGDLASTISALYFVTPEDSENYAAAQTKLAETIRTYQEQTIANAEQLAENGNFDEAIFCVDEAAFVVGYTPELENCLSELYTRKYTILVDDAFAAGDHAGVIRAYREASGNMYVVLTADMTGKYSTCATTYLNDVNARAEEAFGDNKDYSSAIQTLQAAIPDVETDETLVAELTQKIEHYQSYIPVHLASLEYTQKAEYIRVGDAAADDAKDVNGVHYDANTVIHPTGGSLNSETASTEEEACVVYNLNFEYSTLTGTVYRPYRSLSSKKDWSKAAVVKVYGDDVLLYESNAITDATYDTFDFEIDVTGVRNLKIVMLGVWSEASDWIGLYNRHPKVCLGDATLQR